MIIYICDDSQADLMRLSHYLSKAISHLNTEVTIQSFTSGQDLLTAFAAAAEKPALLFLDIYMPDSDGMQTAVTLRENGFTGGIIFTTSHTSHAMDSYNVEALYYLQKPYDSTDFLNAMKRCSSILKDASKTYTFLSKGSEVRILLKDILFFETGRHVTLLHTPSEVLSFTRVLSEVCTDFADNPDFIRVGRSYLINRLYISSFTESEITMADSTVILIPSRLRRTICQNLQAPLG